MKKFRKIVITLVLILSAFYILKFIYFDAARDWRLPFATGERKDFSTIYFEPDAKFKALRPSYDGIPSHYHTGVDMRTKQPGSPGEPVYAIATGKVIQITDSPPMRRIVVRHVLPYGKSVWSVYLHVVEEKVKPGDRVTANTIIARCMNEAELNYFGWKYNHLHLEIMKYPPLQTDNPLKRRSFTCTTPQQIDQYFYDPISFLQSRFRK